MIKFRKPKRLPISKVPSFSFQAWSKMEVHSEPFIVGTKCFRRHIGTNSDLNYSLYWLSPESSSHCSEDQSSNKTESGFDKSTCFRNKKREKQFILNTPLPDISTRFKDETQPVPNTRVPDTCTHFKNKKQLVPSMHIPDNNTLLLKKTLETGIIPKKLQYETQCYQVSPDTLNGYQQDFCESLSKEFLRPTEKHWAIKRPTLPRNAYVLDFQKQKTESETSSYLLDFQKQKTESETSSYVSDSEKIINPFISKKIAMHRRKYNKPLEYKMSSPRTYFYKKLHEPFSFSKMDKKTYLTQTRLDLFTSGHDIFQQNRESVHPLPFLDSFSYMLPNDSLSSSWNVHPRSTILPVVQALHIEKTRPP